ncbi:MAG: hypothetical protein LUE14_11590 [Clostridiales bacterium]|nr:hypothetical protein [Clostridiales bacterium]
MIRRYVIHAIPEFILSLVAAVALCVNVLQSFKLTDEMYTSYGMFIAVTAVVLAALFLVNYSSRTKMIGIPVLIVIAALLIVVCYRVGYSVIETDVTEDNWGVCYLVVIVIAVLAFIAGRTRLGSGIFAVVGAIAHAWICVCLYDFSVWALVIFLLAASVLYLYSRYRHQIIHADARSHAFLPLMGTSVVAVVLAITLTAGVWFGIISPMQPPVLDVKLITRVVSVDVLERIGISKKKVLIDRNEYTAEVEDYETESDELNDEMQEDEEIEGDVDTAPEEDASLTEDLATQQDQSISVNRIAQIFLQDYPILLIILICAAALVVVLAIRRFRRRHIIWLEKLQKQEDRETQIRLLYYLFRKKMQILHISGKKYDSPVCFAKRVESDTMLLDEGGPSWMDLSEIFSRLAYGGISPTQEEYDQYLVYYGRFWKVCRKLCGFKYLWKQFWL